MVRGRNKTEPASDHGKSLALETCVGKDTFLLPVKLGTVNEWMGDTYLVWHL